jgi:hypothetical protein
MNDYEFINKIEEITERRRKEDPVQQEMTKFTEMLYPSKALLGIYSLGYCSMLKMLKENLYQYFCKEDKELFDELVNVLKQNDDFKEILEKILK